MKKKFSRLKARRTLMWFMPAWNLFRTRKKTVFNLSTNIGRFLETMCWDFYSANYSLFFSTDIRGNCCYYCYNIWKKMKWSSVLARQLFSFPPLVSLFLFHLALFSALKGGEEKVLWNYFSSTYGTRSYKWSRQQSMNVWAVEVSLLSPPPHPYCCFSSNLEGCHVRRERRVIGPGG